jgi:hypothetical protein
MVRVVYKNKVVLNGETPLPKLEPRKRLQLAMRAVQGALEEQRAELAAFKETIGELDDVVKTMGESIDGYRDSIDNIDVDGLRRSARKLQEDANDT